MSSKLRLGGIILSLSLVFFLGWQVTRAQNSEESYFPQTGHWVRGPFQEKYQSVSQPEQLFGLPITEAFLEQGTDLYVQYFEKVRMELRLDSSDVYITDIGAFLYPQVNGTPVVEDSGNCRQYPPSNLQVCHEFLKFFEEMGGVEQFGSPVSELESIDGLLVQYFYKARFEWRPDLPQKLWVKVSDLGSHYFRVAKEDPKRLLPAIEGISDDIQVITDLMVRAYPGKAVTSPEDSQSIYIIVQDQKRTKVASATVDIKVVYSSGKVEKFVPKETETNEQGVTKITFPVSTDTTGIVEVFANATYKLSSGEILVGKTVTSFRIWR